MNIANMSLVHNR